MPWLALCALALGCALPADTPHAVDGVLDLSRWSFSDSHSVPLEGRWSICWGRLLEPGAGCPEGWQTVPVSGLWSQQTVRSPIGGHGVATYRLRILRPPGERLALRAGSPSTAHRLWIDGVDRGGAGVVGPTAAATRMGMRNHVYDLPPGAETELWLQVANFEFRSGGLRRPWLAGRPAAIQSLVGWELIRDSLLLGTTLLVGLMSLSSFALRRVNRSHAYFGLFAVVVGLRSPFATWSDLGQLLAPGVSYATSLRLEYAAVAIGIFAAIGYFRSKVPGVMPPRTLQTLQLAAITLVPIQLLAPLSWTLATLYLNAALALLPLLLVILCYGRAWQRGVPGVGTTLVASSIYLFAVGNDVLRVPGWGASLELSPYFALVWIAVEISDQMKSFYRTFARAEQLSNELGETNFELQDTEAAVLRFVPVDFLRMLGKQSIREIEAGDHMRSLMSVVHCEIGSFADILERMPPEEAFRFTNDLIGRLEPCIARREGFVNQYRGDGLQVIFPTGADDAVTAGIELCAAIREFNRGSAERGRPEIDAGIGIDSGPLLLGTLGAGQHLSSGVLGEPVDAAPRIASLARDSDSGLLISSRTRDCLSEAFTPELRETEATVQVGARSLALLEVQALADEKPPAGEPA